MSLPCYADYKDSGVDWLGEVPTHWAIWDSRRLFSERKDRAKQTDRQLTASQRHGIIYQDDYMSIEGQKVVQVISGADILKHVEVNDFVISMRSFQGGLEWSSLCGSISSAYVMLVPEPRICAEFFKYLFKSTSYIQALQVTSNLVRDGQALRYNNFTQVRLPLPPEAEQSAIATFLDREAGKIDALVAEQEKLIALLKEKRQAFVSHAVTKGLDPAVPMKNSGIEWLGEMPAHWHLKRIKDVCDEIVDCKNRTPDKHDDGEYLVVRTSCVRDGKFDASPGYYTDKDSFEEWTRKGRPQAGDILFTREAPAGEACIAPENIAFCLGQRMMYLRPNQSQISPYFLLNVIYGPMVKSYIDRKSKGSTVGHLRVGEVGEPSILVPPQEEQVEITRNLVDLESKFDTLAMEAHRAINLLKERRVALISAAVTGKIDVRGAVQEQAA